MLTPPVGCQQENRGEPPPLGNELIQLPYEAPKVRVSPPVGNTLWTEPTHAPKLFVIKPDLGGGVTPQRIPERHIGMAGREANRLRDGQECWSLKQEPRTYSQLLPRFSNSSLSRVLTRLNVPACR